MENKYQTKKHFGQHFLKNKRVIHKIIEALPECDHVLEIGPGRGALTFPLLEHFAVTAVEIDSDCAEFLQAQNHTNLKIVHADFLKSDISCNTAVGNLPYNIGTKIVEKFVYTPVDCAVFMLQKEVAERITCPTRESYGRLGIFTQARYDVYKVINVAASDFSPAPKVESQVIKLVAHNKHNNVDLKKLDQILRIAFANRRKKLSSLKKTYPELTQQLIENNIDLNLRAENIEKNIFYKIASKK